MTFTSELFLIGLLPWFAVLVFLLKGKKHAKSILVILANIIFYICGGIGAFVFVCLFSLAIWLFQLLISKCKSKIVFGIVIFASLIPLITTKYIVFFIENINKISGLGLNSPNIVIPLGISFFTFEAVSLLSDVRSGKIKSRVTLPDVFSYLTFFVTVTSGPIIRFEDFKAGLNANVEKVDYGYAIERIVIGLSKKVLVADKIAVLADYYFDGVASGNTYSCLGLWLGSIAYTLQLYFDFSGYSDMAVGIGKLLGLDICENFRQPYQARSISDFWRRWHISLSQWFRDYVYIPLGGNRCTVSRHILNMLVVWLLTGIWHGADWSFVLWGIGYFVLLILEKYVPAVKRIGNHRWGNLYTMFFVNLLWVLFRADNISTAGKYIVGMFGAYGFGAIESKAVSFLPYLLAAIVLCLPWSFVSKKFGARKWYKISKEIFVILLAVLSICAVVNSSYSPYIYGNF